MPRIVFDKVSKLYPNGTPAVIDLALTIPDGEFLCVLGPSGCGKSSTVRMLAGLEEVTDGEILSDGRRLNEVPAQQRDAAMVFENYALYPHLSARENIAMPLRARQMDAKLLRERVDEVAATLKSPRYSNESRTNSRAVSVSAWRSDGRSSESRNCS